MASDDLATLERRFFSLVTRPGGPPADGADGAPADRWLVGSPELDAAGRLELYAQMYTSRMVGALAEDFRLARLWLGPEAFDALATEYLAEHPSRHPSLRHFGRAMPGFVRARASSRAGLADLMALEWARGEAFDAADAEPLGWDAITSIAPEAWPSLRLGLGPSVRFVRFESSADELWAALNVEAEPPALREGPRRVLVWRREFLVYHRTLPDDEASALEAVMSGATFGEMCECFTRPDEPAEDSARRAFAALRQWAVDGLLLRA